MASEAPRSPSFVVVIGDRDRDRLDALKDRRESIQPHILEAHGVDDAVARILSAQADLVAVPEDLGGQSHLELCRRVKHVNPRISTLVVREDLSEIPACHPDVDDYVGLGSSDEMMARINVLLSLKTYNARAMPIRERVLEAFRAFELSPDLLLDGRLLPPSKVACHVVLDADIIRDMEAALSRLGDAAFACYLYASRPTCVCSSGRDGCLRGVCPVAQALSDAPGFHVAADDCHEAAWRCARDAMLTGEVTDTLCPGGYRLAAVPIFLRFRSVSYPLLATTVALPSPIDVEQLARLAEQSGVDADALHEEVERRPLPQLSRARIDALLRVQEALAETVSRQVSQEYATAYNVLVEAVERWESDRTLTRRSLQLQHANERLRDLNRLKSEFLANVSHELKTPMTSIIGFTSLLLRGGAGELTEKAERFLNRVLANARTLHAAINDILDLAHLDSRDVRLEPTSFELAPLVDECVEDIRPAVGDKPIELHVDVSAGCTTLTTDRDRLRQVLLSLLKNAAKFTHRGEIRVSAEPVSGEDGPWVHIAVSDTGVGLPSKALPHIFEEFRQVDGSSTRLHGGAGLGLALVRKLTDLLGGEVTVDSRPDEGSTFSVTIPADLGRFQQRRQALKDLVLADEPDLADRDSPVVLAVCYHPQTILDMRAWVAPHDYRVASAFDIDEALERARAIVPYAILLNILSPGQDVWELMDELRADPRTTDVPVVVSSSLGRPELAEAVGAVDWLPRRLTPDTLLNALDRLRTDEAGSVLAIVGDPAARDGLRRALRQAGYHISACATCADATHFARNHYDAIVLDPQAEGQGELTALGTLRAGSQASVPIVAYVPPSFPDGERDYLAGQVDAVLDQSQAGPNEVVETIARLRHRAAGRHEES